jgi:hypothetical protein
VIATHLLGAIPPGPSSRALVLAIACINPFPDIGPHVEQPVYTGFGDPSPCVSAPAFQDSGVV